MPKSRSSNITSTSTTTITIPPTIFHLNKHNRQSSTSSSSSISPHYIHNTSYGLLEPTLAKTTLRPSIHHRRKSSSSTTSSSWSDRGFDLADWRDKSVDLGGKIGERLPGVRYSAAFISTLRTNLALSTSLALPSPNLVTLSPTLYSRRSFSPDLLDPSYLHYSSKMVIEQDPDPLTDVPDLTFTRPQNETDKTAGLKLVADILSQQRSTASKALIYNPVFLAIWAVLVGLLYPFVYRNPATDKPNLGISIVGMLMFALAGVRYLVRPYQELAEEINWEWLGEDSMVIAKFGGTVIGACVYRIDDGGGGTKKTNPSRRLLIRAWTTRPREQRKGIGRGTLEKVVDIAKQKNCSSVEFAPDEIRAGSKRLLTQFDGFGGLYSIQGSFDELESKARDTLKSVLSEKGFEKKRRGSR